MVLSARLAIVVLIKEFQVPSPLAFAIQVIIRIVVRLVQLVTIHVKHVQMVQIVHRAMQLNLEHQDLFQSVNVKMDTTIMVQTSFVPRVTVVVILVRVVLIQIVTLVMRLKIE